MTDNDRAEPMKLLDDEGENQAVRSFLKAYGTPGLTVGAMKNHMRLSGYAGLWPDWVGKESGQHLTKAGAQLWLRHMFAAEVEQGQREVVAPGAAALQKLAARQEPLGPEFAAVLENNLERLYQCDGVPSEAAGAAQPVGQINIVDCSPGMRRLDWADSSWWRDLPSGSHSIYTSTTAAPEGWREAMQGALDEIWGAMDLFAHGRDEAGKAAVNIAERKLRAALNREVEPRTVRMPLKEDDTARLDWLDRMNAALNQRYGTSYGWELILSPNVVRLMTHKPPITGYVTGVDLNDSRARGLPSCRAAIDAAMKEQSNG
jgi:hypothetical protein